MHARVFKGAQIVNKDLLYEKRLQLNDPPAPYTHRNYCPTLPHPNLQGGKNAEPAKMLIALQPMGQHLPKCTG